MHDRNAIVLGALLLSLSLGSTEGWGLLLVAVIGGLCWCVREKIIKKAYLQSLGLGSSHSHQESWGWGPTTNRTLVIFSMFLTDLSRISISHRAGAGALPLIRCGEGRRREKLGPGTAIIVLGVRGVDTLLKIKEHESRMLTWGGTFASMR